jgi:hypothetical protein
VEALGIAAALLPFIAFLALLLVALRRQWRQILRPSESGDGGGRRRGAGPAGDREPRRPLVPVASGAAALPLPIDAGDTPDAISPSGGRVANRPGERRLAS